MTGGDYDVKCWFVNQVSGQTNRCFAVFGQRDLIITSQVTRVGTAGDVTYSRGGQNNRAL